MIEGLTALCQQYYFQSYSRRRPVFAHSHMFQFKSRFILVTKAPKLIIWGARAPARLTNYMKSFMGNRVRNHLVTLLIVNTTALTIDYHIQISVRDRAEHIEQKMTWESLANYVTRRVHSPSLKANTVGLRSTLPIIFGMGIICSHGA